MQKKEKIIIGLNLVVSIILLVIGVVCFVKCGFIVPKENETSSITTEITETTTLTTGTETSTTSTETIPTNSENSNTTGSEAKTTTTAETTTDFVGPIMPVETTLTTEETLKLETIAETTSSTEVVSSVFTTEGTTIPKTSAAIAKKSTTITTTKEIPLTPVAATSSKGLTLIKTFTRGTYYAYGGPRKGGSGRQLINCATGGQGVKGSIASWYLYKKLGYNYKGKRTKVYLEIKGYPKMNGWYYLDDSCAPGYNNVCDFFYINGKSCPFSRQGVVQVKCYI